MSFLVLLSWTSLRGQISGQVLDMEGLPLPGATVMLFPDTLGTGTDQEGRFTFEGLDPGQYWIQAQFIGYETERVAVQVVGSPSTSKPLEIRLAEKGELLETIVVTDEHAKQENSLAAVHLSEHFLEEHSQGTFAKSIEKLPGISAINVGVGIAKPVIRGLSSNRIIVNHQGIKQESHQWGADHGLEIDQYDVERVEIIKGPASLQYGSDGLGGVINIMPGRILPKGTFVGSVQGTYKTNNQHWGGSALLG
ncbi:MAG: TonB-dependent receptor, partial [Phaeodactylibacter sp.]|nr:TonB-dependent receptor [Phaeodactylibacter sp.]